MDTTTMWLAQERLVDARQRAAKHRVARVARHGRSQSSLIRRIRGGR